MGVNWEVASAARIDEWTCNYTQVIPGKGMYMLIDEDYVMIRCVSIAKESRLSGDVVLS